MRQWELAGKDTCKNNIDIASSTYNKMKNATLSEQFQNTTEKY